MACTAVPVRSLSLSISIPASGRSRKKQALTFSSPSHFLSLGSSLPKPRSRNPRPGGPLVLAALPDLAKIFQTAWKVGKDGIEAGTNLVPDSVPRPIARIGVTIGLLAVAQFVLGSFLSTAFFAVGTMGLVYFIYLALNKDKDEGPRGGGGGGGGGGKGSSDDPVEQARRIMEKYK